MNRFYLSASEVRHNALLTILTFPTAVQGDKRRGLLLRGLHTRMHPVCYSTTPFRLSTHVLAASCLTGASGQMELCKVSWLPFQSSRSKLYHALYVSSSFDPIQSTERVKVIGLYDLLEESPSDDGVTVSHKLNSEAFGQLDPRTCEMLLRICSGAGDAPAAVPPTVRPHPGVARWEAACIWHARSAGPSQSRRAARCSRCETQNK